MTYIPDMPITQLINYRYSELVVDFIIYSDVLGGIKRVIPKGFIMDWETIWIFRGTSSVSGLIHDYFCRYDSIPIVTKKQATDIYSEFLIYRNTSKVRYFIKRFGVIAAFNYFHKLSVLERSMVDDIKQQQKKGIK